MVFSLFVLDQRRSERNYSEGQKQCHGAHLSFMSFNGLNSLNYRPQTEFAKVMFSQVFVCPQQGLCPGGSLSRGSLSRGRRSLSRDLCPGGSIQGVSVQGEGLCPGGLCPGALSRGISVQGVSIQEVSVKGALSRGSISRGVSFQGWMLLSRQGGLCQGDPHTVTWGQYASYWNAFLFLEIITRKCLFECIKTLVNWKFVQWPIPQTGICWIGFSITACQWSCGKVMFSVNPVDPVEWSGPGNRNSLFAIYFSFPLW